MMVSRLNGEMLEFWIHHFCWRFFSLKPSYCHLVTVRAVLSVASNEVLALQWLAFLHLGQRCDQGHEGSVKVFDIWLVLDFVMTECHHMKHKVEAICSCLKYLHCSQV